MNSLLKAALVIALLTNSFYSAAQLPTYPDSVFSTYYHQRVALFKLLPTTGKDVVFVGNSITDGGEWAELFDDTKIKNRGISGDITAGVLHRLPNLVAGKPAKLFLMIGTNDLARGVSADSVVKNIILAIEYVQRYSPSTKVFVQSILPVTDAFKKFSGHTSKAALIRQVNEQLAVKANTNGYTYIDVYTPFLGEDGKMDQRYTNDGLHLLGEGYLLWKHIVYPFVYGTTNRPALLPLPQEIKWTDKYFPIYKVKSVYINDKSLAKEANLVVDLFSSFAQDISLSEFIESKGFQVQLKLTDEFFGSKSAEAYKLNVSSHSIEIIASTSNGIFNGIQTLKQLMRDGVIIPTCNIQDWPAFAWRGFMIDVGRNYMPMELLKEQIDVMANYKMNVFHFHPTEDIAWRIQIKQYPQLTAPENMLRNKGKYYSIEEIKELIQYCKERHIEFIPEIDMPGHSAAFKRAMGTDMQSEEGKVIVANILKEIVTTYDINYVHIGSDEVKIVDTSFVPTMTTLLESKGKQVIGWEPGGNFKATTIRQLWREDGSSSHLKKGLRFIDSKHLYLNHMDPLEAVTTIYNRQLADRDIGDSLALGAILCVWHDRAAATFEDVIKMNPVYPGILSFAERSWRGGGQKGWIANMSDGDEKGFSEFEQRLLAQQYYFKNQPFPYAKQSHLKWDLYGPYDNKGNLLSSFAIEQQLNEKHALSPNLQVRGGTIVLRHWWSPWIKGAVEQPKENTTWYATTKIWSDEERIGKFWISFSNLSRSTATDSPPLGSWDYNQGRLWVNANPVPPPQWQRANQNGNLEIPLVDEGYEFRPPTQIQLKKGWNSVLIKAPIGSFKARAAQHPTKWMFTFVEVD